MVSKQQYESIQESIVDIIDGSGRPIDPSGLLLCLREQGISRELGSTIMWEMIGAGYIIRSTDWLLSHRSEVETQTENIAYQ